MRTVDLIIGHTCPWGGDCQDCGPRDLADSVPGMAYGQPTPLDYKDAHEFMCETKEGSHCQKLLATKYADFHGESNVYTSIIRTLCLDTSCALADSAFQYHLPYGTDARSCYAAQTFVAHLLEHLFFTDDDDDLSSFVNLCSSDGLGNAAAFDVSCTADERPDGATTLHPLLGPQSFHLARQSLCSGNRAGMVTALSMLSDLRVPDHAQTGGKSSVLVSHFPADQACSFVTATGAGITEDSSAPALTLCALLPFAEYMTLEAGVPQPITNDPNSMGCCEASSIIIADLLRQSDRATFDTVVCPRGDARCAGIPDMVRVGLAHAKMVLSQSPECLSTAWGFISAMKEVSTSASKATRALSDMLQHISKDDFDDVVMKENLCWLQWSISKRPMNRPRSCCEAADVLLAHHLRFHEPAIAPDVYVDFNASSLSDEIVARSLSHICNNHWGTELDEFLAATAFGALVEDFSFQTMCDDPCRCTADIPEAPGCGLHGGHAEREGTYYPDQQRPFCYVVDPANCKNAIDSTLAGMDGMAWTYCSVSHDTCQGYGGTGPCAPFVPEGTMLFVPAGSTLESLQFIGDEHAVSIIEGDNANAAEERLGLAVGSNLLQAWLLEAMLVSPASYGTHGQFICDSRLRRCDSATADFGAQHPQPRTQPVCHRDCVDTMEGKDRPIVVFFLLAIGLITSPSAFDLSTQCHDSSLSLPVPPGLFVPITGVGNAIQLQQPHWHHQTCQGFAVSH